MNPYLANMFLPLPMTATTTWPRRCAMDAVFYFVMMTTRKRLLSSFWFVGHTWCEWAHQALLFFRWFAKCKCFYFSLMRFWSSLFESLIQEISKKPKHFSRSARCQCHLKNTH
jgi:hypothetical protein